MRMFSADTSSGAPAGGGSSFDPISAGVNAAATIANTIAGISDMNKRRLIESNLALLSEKERIELAQKISKQRNKNEQATILINTVMAARNANADRAQRTQTVKWVLIGTAAVTVLGIIAWYYKRK